MNPTPIILPPSLARLRYREAVALLARPTTTDLWTRRMYFYLARQLMDTMRKNG